MKNAQDYLRQPYARIVIPVGENSYHAEILEFPGCFAQGDTAEQAYSNLENAAESWIGACLAQGQEVPEPSSNLTYSGRIAFRLPRSIHRKAAQLAGRDATSLNTFLISAVSAKVGVEDFYGYLADSLEQRLARAVYVGYMAATRVDQIDDTAAKVKVFPRLKISETSGTTDRKIGG